MFGVTDYGAFIVAIIVWAIIKYTIGMRVTQEEEIEGLDFGEHGNRAYPDFQTVQGH